MALKEPRKTLNHPHTELHSAKSARSVTVKLGAVEVRSNERLSLFLPKKIRNERLHHEKG